ncbi:uncharacterized protein [Rutidosis leptorrhynchoides]|uniref:uncharacterized protein n=1 Tax=Rutidosis leptorrhynchoides TaxID=125765 RepID=UPI003A9A4EEA
MFFNFPEIRGVSDIWVLFKKFGTMNDVSLARNRLKNGHRFGFARFECVRDLTRLLEQLNKVQIMGWGLRAYKAHERKDNNWKVFSDRNSNEKYKTNTKGNNPRSNMGERVYGTSRIKKDEVVWKMNVSKAKENDDGKSGSLNKLDMEYFPPINVESKHIPTNESAPKANDSIKHNNTRENYSIPTFWSNLKKDKPEDSIRVVILDEKSNNNNLLDRAIVGEVINHELIDQFKTLCEEEGFCDFELKYLGGLDMMIVANSVEMVNIVLKNKNHGIRRWLLNVRRWDKFDLVAGRLTWIKVIGVPVSYWRETTFEKIGGWWGKVLDMENCELEGDQNLTFGKVLVKVTGCDVINDTVLVDDGLRTFYVKAIEDVNETIQMEIIKEHDAVDQKSSVHSDPDDMDEDPEQQSDDEENLVPVVDNSNVCRGDSKKIATEKSFLRVQKDN